MDLKTFLFGQDDKIKKKSNFNEGQNQFFNQYTQNATQNMGGMNDIMSLLQSMLDPNSDFFKNFEDQQMNQFNEETLPNIGERFAGAGAQGGALSSSGFGQALSAGASGLQKNLASGKSNMILQALQQLMGQYNQQTQNVLNAQPYMYANKPGNSGLFPGMMMSFAKNAGGAMGGGM